MEAFGDLVPYCPLTYLPGVLTRLPVQLVPDVERHCRPRLLRPRVLGVDPCRGLPSSRFHTSTAFQRAIPVSPAPASRAPRRERIRNSDFWPVAPPVVIACLRTRHQGLCAFKGSTGGLSQPLACPEYILSVRLGAHSVSKQTNSSELGQFRAPERV